MQTAYLYCPNMMNLEAGGEMNLRFQVYISKPETVTFMALTHSIELCGVERKALSLPGWIHQVCHGVP